MPQVLLFICRLNQVVDGPLPQFSSRLLFIFLLSVFHFESDYRVCCFQSSFVSMTEFLFHTFYSLLQVYKAQMRIAPQLPFSSPTLQIGNIQQAQTGYIGAHDMDVGGGCSSLIDTTSTSFLFTLALSYPDWAIKLILTLRCCRSELCLCCCFQPSCVVSQQS